MSGFGTRINDGESRSSNGGANARISFKSEPTTYGRNSSQSYVRDLVRSRSEVGDSSAIERIKRHVAEVRVDLASRNDPGSVELRTSMSRTDGAGGEFVPPVWLLDQYIALARASRITADLFVGHTLPAGTDQLNFPKIATGATTATLNDASVPSNTDLTTSTISAGVKTIAGQQVFALQLLEQSPISFDEVVFADLIADLANKIDVQCLTGSGSGANAKGVMTAGVAGANALITYTDASPTVPEIYSKMANAMQQIHTNRFKPPQCWIMHPSRWGWFLAAEDSGGRPLVLPTTNGIYNGLGIMSDVRSQGVVGSILGLPVYVDALIPTTSGGGTEDRIICARVDDLHLYEGPIRTRVLFETDANTMQVRLQAYQYFTTVVDAYSYSVGMIGGAVATVSSGMQPPSF